MKYLQHVRNAMTSTLGGSPRRRCRTDRRRNSVSAATELVTTRRE